MEIRIAKFAEPLPNGQWRYGIMVWNKGITIDFIPYGVGTVKDYNEFTLELKYGDSNASKEVGS